MTKEERNTVLLELRAWLIENHPILPKTEHTTLWAAGRKARNAAIDKKIRVIKEKARINQKWRERMSNRLNIELYEIVKATNTIIGIIEKTLLEGDKVRLRNFGDFWMSKAQVNGGIERRYTFKPDENWIQLLNNPLFKREIGLKRKLRYQPVSTG